MQTQTKWRCAIVCIFAVLVLWASMRASSPSSTSSASEAFDEVSDSTTAKAGFTIVERGQPADGAPVILAPHAENRASSDDERIVNVQPSTPAPVIVEDSAAAQCRTKQYELYDAKWNTTDFYSDVPLSAFWRMFDNKWPVPCRANATTAVVDV